MRISSLSLHVLQFILVAVIGANSARAEGCPTALNVLDSTLVHLAEGGSFEFEHKTYEMVQVPKESLALDKMALNDAGHLKTYLTEGFQASHLTTPAAQSAMVTRISPKAAFNGCLYLLILRKTPFKNQKAGLFALAVKPAPAPAH